MRKHDKDQFPAREVMPIPANAFFQYTAQAHLMRQGHNLRAHLVRLSPDHDWEIDDLCCQKPRTA